MQCDECKELYRADNPKQPCPRCGGKGTVLVDITSTMYANRAARRKDKIYHGKKVEKYLPCPECKSGMQSKAKESYYETT